MVTKLDSAKIKEKAIEYHKLVKDVETKFKKANTSSSKFVKLLGELGKCYATSIPKYAKYEGREGEIKAELKRVEKDRDVYCAAWESARKSLNTKIKKDSAIMKAVGNAENDKYGANYSYFNRQGKLKEGKYHTELDVVSRKYREN